MAGNRKGLHVRRVSQEVRKNMIETTIHKYQHHELAEKYIDLHLRYETLKKMYDNSQPKLFD